MHIYCRHTHAASNNSIIGLVKLRESRKDYIYWGRHAAESSSHCMLAAAAVMWLELLVAEADDAAVGGELPIGLPGCLTRCGDVSVPFPFGLEPGCHLRPSSFNLTCNPVIGMLWYANTTALIVNISLDDSTMRLVPSLFITLVGLLGLQDTGLRSKSCGNGSWHPASCHGVPGTRRAQQICWAPAHAVRLTTSPAMYADATMVIKAMRTSATDAMVYI